LSAISINKYQIKQIRPKRGRYLTEIAATQITFWILV
jgi:hypothetical protein